jgi:hypothetical protein
MQASIVKRMRVIVSPPVCRFGSIVAGPRAPGKAILATETAIDRDGWLDPGYDFDTAVR